MSDNPLKTIDDLNHVARSNLERLRNAYHRVAYDMLNVQLNHAATFYFGDAWSEHEDASITIDAGRTSEGMCIVRVRSFSLGEGATDAQRYRFTEYLNFNVSDMLYELQHPNGFLVYPISRREEISYWSDRDEYESDYIVVYNDAWDASRDERYPLISFEKNTNQSK